jgi:hypothetical protein
MVERVDFDDFLINALRNIQVYGNDINKLVGRTGTLVSPTFKAFPSDKSLLLTTEVQMGYRLRPMKTVLL